MALLEPGASCPGARLWIRAHSSCGRRRRRGRKAVQRDPQPWNCAGSAAGEFSALDPRYPMSLLRDLRSSSGGQNAPQLGSPWRPGSPRAMGRTRVRAVSSWKGGSCHLAPTLQGQGSLPAIPCMFPSSVSQWQRSDRDQKAILTPGSHIHCLKLRDTQPWGPWHLRGLNFQSPLPPRNPFFLSPDTPYPRDPVGDSGLARRETQLHGGFAGALLLGFPTLPISPALPRVA